MNYYIGWDVGGWNCDHNRTSRDALCALTGDVWDALTLVGVAWRGNLRATFLANGILTAMLDKVQVHLHKGDKVVWGIDTPLGWPTAFRTLLGDNVNVVDVPEESHLNPYLFRRTEQRLVQQGFQPLSAVRDMIGSQSTKGIHFLRRCGFCRKTTGIWSSSSHTAIETYPTPARENARLQGAFAGLQSRLLQQPAAAGMNALNDVQDSLWCALVAAMFTLDPTALHSPDGDIPPEEGWIWVPNDINAGHH